MMKKELNVIKAVMMAVIFAVPMTMVSLNANAESPQGPVYQLNSENSKINWKGTKPGGEHYGYIDVIKGSINMDGETISGGTFTIDMNSIVNEDLTNENFNDRLVGHLKSEDFFHTEVHPNAYFSITSVAVQHSATDDFTANRLVTGDLTIKGIKKEISFPAYIEVGDDGVSAKTGEIVLDRTEWNVNYQSKKIFSNLADNFIHDEMIVSLNLNFTEK
jgi:polyisoprenoid-binding protein YceI